MAGFCRFPAVATVFAVVAFAVFAPPAAASVEAAPLNFERFGARDGLRAETISAVLQDRTGFIWVATRDGLAMYDGGRFRTFYHEIGLASSLADNDLRTVFEDREGRLWIATNTAGLDLLDRTTWTFRHYRHDAADPCSLSHESVYALAEDGSGRLWVGTQDGLNQFDPHKGKFLRVDLGQERGVKAEYIYALIVDPDETLWVATVGGGIGRRDPQSGRFTWFRHDPADPDSLPSDRVFALARDPGGTLWAGTWSGLARWDSGQGGFRRVRTRQGDEAAPGIISSLAPGDRGTLWIGTLKGIYELDTATGEARWRDHRTDSERPASEGRILSLFVDRSGGLWIGTATEGLNHVRLPARIFTTLPTGGRTGLAIPDANAVLEDRGGRLWVGTFGGGLHRRDPGQEGFRVFPGSDADAAHHIDPRIYRLFEDSRGRLWVGTVGGLFRLEPEKGTVEAFQHDPGNPHSLGAGYVTAIAEDSAGTLWVGTGGGGLCRLRHDGGGFERLVHRAGDPSSLGDNYVSAVAEDRAGRMWIGTRSGGLHRFDRETGRFARFAPDPRDPASLSHTTVTALLEDRLGTLWVATAGGGLNRVAFHGGTVAFERVTEAEGLADNNVVSLVEDDDGSLWIGTRGGLSRFDPQSGAVQNYGAGDGLPSIAFNNGAVSRGRTVIRFGSLRGVVEIPRGTAFEKPAPSPTIVTSIRTLAGPLVADRPVWELSAAAVPYGEILAVEFAVLDFREPFRHRFAYRLAAGEPWVDLGPRRDITFTRIQPGEYDLALRGRNALGVWSETRPLRLRIVPPFWLTAWFRLLLVCGVAAAAWGGHRVRTSALKRRNRVLLELQSRLETALGQSQAKEEQLREAYERLRALTRRLEEAKEEERKHIARELHDEMGQALTAAKITIDLATRGKGPEASDVREAGQIVDQIIDQVRNLSLNLRPPLIDEVGLVPALAGYLEAQARRSGVEIRLEAPQAGGRLPADVEITAFRVVQEAVTNVLRHAGAAHVTVLVRRGERHLELAVRDDGRGFEPGEVLARPASARHLGLVGIRERVELHGGRVEIRSGPGKGTEIEAWLKWEGAA